MPIVFRFEGYNNEVIDDITKLYLKQIAFYKTESIADRRHFVENLLIINHSLLEYSADIRKLDEIKLALSLYILILPEVGLFNKDNNKFVEDYLTEVYEAEFKHCIDSTNILFADFLYVLAWVYRRNTKYKKALACIEKGISIFKDDARFYHGRFLIKVCELSQTSDSVIKANMYDLILKDIEQALELYPKILEFKSSLIRDNIVAVLLNSKLYALLLSIDLNSAEALTTLAALRNELLVPIKQMLGDNYKIYPEIMHTEAFLEYLESQLYPILEDKKLKIQTVKNILNSAIKIAESMTNYHYESYIRLLAEIEEYGKPFVTTPKNRV